ncbi:MAG: hypothetical protein WCX97_03035 [Candidatus Magasanikbacteria bacterium]
MTKSELFSLREQVLASESFKEGTRILDEVAQTLERFSGYRVIVDKGPAFLVEPSAYEIYRACTIDEASEFEDHFMVEDEVVSRSCLLSFAANMERWDRELINPPLMTGDRNLYFSDEIIFYLSLGAYARVETNIVPGIRETVFPQLEVEVLARIPDSKYYRDRQKVTLVKILFGVQKSIFKLLGLKCQPRFRFNIQSSFLCAVEGLSLITQRNVRKLMDELETAKVGGYDGDVKKIADAIRSAVPETHLGNFKDEWLLAPHKQDTSIHSDTVWSHTLVGGPATYGGEIFDTDYTTSTGVLFTEVAGGGNFTPLAQRFGLPSDWQAIGFAVGWLRLWSALQMEKAEEKVR